MENNSSGEFVRKVSPVVFISIVIEIILIIVVIVTIVNFIQGKQAESEIEEKTISYGIKIPNFRQEIQTVNKNSMKDIVFSVYDAVWLNAENISSEIVANIREGSVKDQYYEEMNLHRLYFIVDIPDFQQTYQVTHLYSDLVYNGNIPTNYRTMVYCPSESQTVYEGQVCRDRYAGKAEKIIKSWWFE